jgi:cobalt-zinc-cadmium efflux system membrane fusion protein
VVKAGQPLIELESPEVGRARAAQLTAAARAELGRSALARKQSLSADQIVPQRELQAAQAELAEAEAEQRGAEQTLAALSAQRGQGGRFTLLADLAGTVLERDAPRGRMLEPGQRLFAIADLGRLWLVAHAFERDALRIRSGSTAQVSFAALPGQTFAGQVARIGNQVDPSSRTLDVLLTVDNPERLLRPGMSASARLPLGASNATVVAVPVAALQRLPQGWCVFIALPEEGAFAIRAVGRGRDLGGEVEVVSGLRAGEHVVVDGAFLLKAEADKARGGGEEHHH